MNQNTQTILNHITTTLILRDENINADGSPNWNFLDADIHGDVDDGILKAELISDDIDAAFAVVDAIFKRINAAIDNAVFDKALEDNALMIAVDHHLRENGDKA